METNSQQTSRPVHFSVSKPMGGSDGQSPLEAVSILCRGNEGTQLEHTVHQPDTENTPIICGVQRIERESVCEGNHIGDVARVHESIREQECGLPEIQLCDHQRVSGIRGASSSTQVQVSRSGKGPEGSLAHGPGNGEGLDLKDETEGSTRSNEWATCGYAQMRSPAIDREGREGCPKNRGDNGIREGKDEIDTGASRVHAGLERISTIDGLERRLASVAHLATVIRLDTAKGWREAGNPAQFARVEKDVLDQAPRGERGVRRHKQDRGAQFRRDDSAIHSDGCARDEGSDTETLGSNDRTEQIARVENTLNNHLNPPDTWIELASYVNPLDRYAVFNSFSTDKHGARRVIPHRSVSHFPEAV